MTTIVTTTVRLPEGLKAEAEALASSLGISMTALMAVALRDYLDRPVTRWSGVPSLAAGHVAVVVPAPAPRPAPAPAAVLAVPVAVKAPRSRADPCPCGAVGPNGFRLKYRQCHGLKG